LNRYADMFGLRARIRFGAQVDCVGREGTGWQVTSDGVNERFDRVVVATGRFRSPAVPAVPGLATFTGSAGVISTFDYRGAQTYVGTRVLVAGCAVSALDIATELGRLGAARVVVTQRRQRYVLPKFAAGVPSDHRIFTRWSHRGRAAPRGGDRPAIEGDRGRGGRQPGAVRSACARPFPLRRGRHAQPAVPSDRGGGPHHGATVDEFRRETTVTFADGHAEKFDAIVFGTGSRWTCRF